MTLAANSHETRRVRETFTRVIDNPRTLSRIQTGDVIYKNGEEYGEVTEVSDQVSDVAGIHVEVDDEHPIRLELLRKWLADDRYEIRIEGPRSYTKTELKGIDY